MCRCYFFIQDDNLYVLSGVFRSLTFKVAIGIVELQSTIYLLPICSIFFYFRFLFLIEQLYEYIFIYWLIIYKYFKNILADSLGLVTCILK